MIDVKWHWEYTPGFIQTIPNAKRHRANMGGKQRRIYKDVLCAFDIETTRLTGEQHPIFDGEKGENERAIVYSWALHFHGYMTYRGRTLDEFARLLAKLRAELAGKERLVIWVHNLSYEFQFLRGIYDFSAEEVFCTAPRKVLRADMKNAFEFRCSYLHSNMSLAEYTRKYNVKHKKLDGEAFDYEKTRYPWTLLTEAEWLYQLHDVWGLCEALEAEMQLDGDDLYSVPLTSTGYVRREVKKAMREYSRYKLPATLPDYATFTLLRKAFRGGDTHANRYYTGRIIEDVMSADRSSSYPDVQCNRPFPVGSWLYVNNPDSRHINLLINKRKKAYVMRAKFTNIALRNIRWGFPYISRDKCENLRGGLYDNGRVLKADELITTFTDVDFTIMSEQYKWESMEALEMSCSRYGKLPDEYTGVAKEYYRRKTELKDVAGQEIYYMKSKNLLNSIYGMSAQNPAKPHIDFKNGQFIEREESAEDLLLDGYKNAFQSYAWGVWTTAWARYELQQGLKLAGDGAIYCDTDSVKYIGEIDWTAYNRERILASASSGAFATDTHGKTHYMGVFEMEKEYRRFATLGAKKYAFQYSENGETLVTIAGVTKRTGGAELDEGDEHGNGLERFVLLEPPFTFRKAGGTEARYCDSWSYRNINVGGGVLDIAPCVVIRPSTYTLGITEEYRAILEGLKNPLAFW